MLAFEGDSHVGWFEGNYEDYEKDRKRRMGADADQPHRIKYRKNVWRFRKRPYVSKFAIFPDTINQVEPPNCIQRVHAESSSEIELMLRAASELFQIVVGIHAVGLRVRIVAVGAICVALSIVDRASAQAIFVDSALEITTRARTATYCGITCKPAPTSIPRETNAMDRLSIYGEESPGWQYVETKSIADPFFGSQFGFASASVRYGLASDSFDYFGRIDAWGNGIDQEEYDWVGWGTSGIGEVGTYGKTRRLHCLRDL